MPRRKSCRDTDAWMKEYNRNWMKGVLMSNWYEDQFQDSCDKTKPPLAKVTEYSCNYIPYDESPDFMIKYENRIKLREGKPKELMYGPYDRCSSKYLITAYDEHINRRERPCDQLLPCLRTRSCLKNAWLPEKSDYPLLGAPTNWGLHDVRRQELLKRIEMLNSFKDEMVSTYQRSYDHPALRRRTAKTT